MTRLSPEKMVSDDSHAPNEDIEEQMEVQDYENGLGHVKLGLQEIDQNVMGGTRVKKGENRNMNVGK